MNRIFKKLNIREKTSEDKIIINKGKHEVTLTNEQIEIAEKIKFWEIQKDYNKEIVKRLKTYEKQISELKTELEKLKNVKSVLSDTGLKTSKLYNIKNAMIISAIALISSLIAIINVII
ncbi:hypothetical protein [Aminipila sp.]|uniref:hypothetical protein n=1 Tax=Aminipila sp. TaxID=2060095 RepID=UPI00289C9EAA|nr:hypothetical protein [Aminipila sp.]